MCEIAKVLVNISKMFTQANKSELSKEMIQHVKNLKSLNFCMCVVECLLVRVMAQGGSVLVVAR